MCFAIAYMRLPRVKVTRGGSADRISKSEQQKCYAESVRVQPSHHPIIGLMDLLALMADAPANTLLREIK